MEKKTFYITTPIFYPNGPGHMGHAYVAIISDVAARYQRLLGKDVYFLTGTDENTGKIAEVAKKAGVTPQEFVEEIVKGFKSFFASLLISNDQFIRTSDTQVHWPGAQEMWKRLVAAGDIYKSRYEGLYCLGCESFKTEKDLVDGLCPDHGVAPEHISEENYCFKLSNYSKKVKDLIETGEFVVEPEGRKNEILSLLESGLEDISFSRPVATVPWGIPVPGDPTQVMYVWCDALTNYITALGFGSADTSRFDTFWPADAHMVGKDIIRFHAGIWPAMLLSAGLPLPKKVFVHGLLLSGGKKMSKTLGNIIDPKELIDAYGPEALRYYFTHISPREDGEITTELFKEVYNGKLANGLGNLVSRVVKMAGNYDVSTEGLKFLTFTELLVSPEGREYADAFETFRFNDACDVIWKMIAACDLFIQDNEPFKTIKTDPDKAKADIQTLLLRLWDIALLLTPVMPHTSEKIKEAITAKTLAENLFARKD